MSFSAAAGERWHRRRSVVPGRFGAALILLALVGSACTVSADDPFDSASRTTATETSGSERAPHEDIDNPTVGESRSLTDLRRFNLPSAVMEPTLPAGESVWVDQRETDPERGDIIVYESSGGEGLVLKRVIAVGGDAIGLRDGDVFLNGRLLDEPYLRDEVSTLLLGPLPGCVGEPSTECVVPPDHIFVMGDNRSGSWDSRRHGPVPVADVVGTVILAD